MYLLPDQAMEAPSSKTWPPGASQLAVRPPRLASRSRLQAAGDQGLRARADLTAEALCFQIETRGKGTLSR